MIDTIEKPKIIIVDDLEKNLFALELMLEPVDAEIFKAQSGNEALTLTLYHEFALTLIDVHMPEMNGYELAEYLRVGKKTQEIPIIFVTAIDRNEQNMFKGYEKGAVDFLFKPIQEQVLMSKVLVFLDLYRRRHLLELEIEKRKKIEDELIKAKEKAEEANRIKSQFLANMSHDFRTPLHVIIGLTDKMSKVNGFLKENDQIAKSLELVSKSSHRLLVLVNDILDASKVESGKLDFFFEPVLFSEILDGFNETIKVLLASKPVTFKITNAIKDYIVTDKARVQQIIVNLLSNAAKFTEKGSIQLKTYIENNFIYIQVEDTGIGLKKSDAKKIFESFSQINSQVSRKHRGTGLGLSICKGFTEKLGGKIWVESEYSVGSKFIFSIPYEKAKKTELEASRSQMNINNCIRTLSDKRILYCDDDEFNLAFAKMIFTERTEFDLAESGYEAIDLAKQHQYDLIFLDIQMPGIDGYQTLKEIRKNAVDVPIIALTALAFKDTAENMMKKGFTRYLSKPFKEDELIRLCHETLTTKI